MVSRPATSQRKKFDLQLDQADVRENDLAARLSAKGGKRVELKSERYLWERTGNICIEYRHRGMPSGIAVTEAEWWAHELVDDEERVVMTLMIPVDRLKAVCRDNIRRGMVRRGVGDDGNSDVILVNIAELAKLLLDAGEKGRD